VCQKGYVSCWSFVPVGMDLTSGFGSFVVGSLDVVAGYRDDPDCCCSKTRLNMGHS
jgi:hypothetical protein